MSAPIDAVLAAVRASAAGAQVARLAITHPADDDHVWFIRRSGGTAELQINSHHPDGQPPFTIETDQHGGSITVTTVEEAIEVIDHWLLAAP